MTFEDKVGGNTADVLSVVSGGVMHKSVEMNQYDISKFRMNLNIWFPYAFHLADP